MDNQNNTTPEYNGPQKICKHCKSNSEARQSMSILRQKAGKHGSISRQCTFNYYFGSTYFEYPFSV